MKLAKMMGVLGLGIQIGLNALRREYTLLK